MNILKVYFFTVLLTFCAFQTCSATSILKPARVRARYLMKPVLNNDYDEDNIEKDMHLKTIHTVYYPNSKEPIRFDCHKYNNILYTCTYDNSHRKPSYTTWQHFYDCNSNVGPELKIKAEMVKYQFYLESFDNNTFLRVMPERLQSNKIVFKSYVKPSDENISKLTFTDKKDVIFDCGEYSNNAKHVYVGLINTRKHKIETMNTTRMVKKLGKEHNGNMLCCLFYTIYEELNEKQVVRYVRNKTLLVFNQNSNESCTGKSCADKKSDNNPVSEGLLKMIFGPDNSNKTDKTSNVIENSNKIAKTEKDLQDFSDRCSDANCAVEESDNNPVSEDLLEMIFGPDNSNKTDKPFNVTEYSNKIAKTERVLNDFSEGCSDANCAVKESDNKTVSRALLQNIFGPNNLNKSDMSPNVIKNTKKVTKSERAKLTKSTSMATQTDFDEIQDFILSKNMTPIADSHVTRNPAVLYTSITAAVLILAVAIIIVVRKRCFNKTPSSSEPKPAPRKRKEPFYLNMLFRKECDKEIEAQRQEQEPVYEEIS
ncbi:uncharacterized protein LOC135119069 [Helicoverpa armigera]|uniref:uncharacterized protein LOC135119069 n=1 Tax=Helicoverpa armigera TaxID=29058 RepID=UPI003082C67C